MKSEAKKILLDRKFRSIEYMRLYVELYRQLVEAMERGMNAFFALQKQNPSVDEDNIQAWVVRGLPNLKGNVAYAEDALRRAENGDDSYLVSSAGDLKGLSRDVDHIGGFGEWWKELDPQYETDFYKAFNQSHFAACNIYRTGLGHWRPDSILKETITGPIDKNELLNYLKPGERLEDLA